MGGGLYFPEEYSYPVLGTRVNSTLTPVTLTSAFADTRKSIRTDGYSILVLNILYTTGAAETNNSIEIQLEDSVDDTNFFILTNEAASAGTSTLTQRQFTFVGASAATAYALSYRLDITYPYMRISAKESGVAANAGTVYIESILGGR